MKYQGQFITVVMPDTAETESDFGQLYGVSAERTDALANQLAAHCSTHTSEAGNLLFKAMLETLPIEAATPGELVLAGIFIGQLSSGLVQDEERRKRRNVLQKLFAD